ncbi:MAG: ABC transporter permease [Magnetococcales bacterium]|nr:ABC transporter permease [Magnetococcales bacterium]MBF0155991.1 ABC transporter permease [Magnetococcales bacterium]
MSFDNHQSSLGSWYGTWSLFRRESRRFLKVWLQTVWAPLISALLYFAIFGGALGKRIGDTDGVSFLLFLVPGLAAMGMIQHAYQNTSSSLIQMKYLGMLPADLLALPITPLQMTLAFVAAAILRGSLVGGVILLVSRVFVDFGVAHPLLLLLATVVLTAIFALVGLLTGVWGSNYDEVAMVGNFILTPLIYLGGVFFSVSMLPDSWAMVARLNPIFYLVDLFRYALIDVSQARPEVALVAVLGVLGALFAGTVRLLASGWRLKN